MTNQIPEKQARQGKLGIPVALVLTISLLGIIAAGWFIFV